MRCVHACHGARVALLPRPNQGRLGDIYANGWGVPVSNATALQHYQRGVDAKDPASMNGLATLQIRMGVRSVPCWRRTARASMRQQD